MAKKSKSKPQAQPAVLDPRRPYDPPESAAQLWVNPEGQLVLGLPTLFGRDGYGHYVTLRGDAESQVKFLISTLLARQAARPTVGTPGAPIQAMLDALLKSTTVKVTHAVLSADKLDESDFDI